MEMRREHTFHCQPLSNIATPGRAFDASVLVAVTLGVALRNATNRLSKRPSGTGSTLRLIPLLIQ
jgi:hypothetical protein